MKLFAAGRMAMAVIVVAGLAACGGGGGGTTDAGAASSGSLRVALTDAPACGYNAVNITVEKIRVHQSSSAAETDAGWSEIVLNPSRRVDLLSLSNGVLSELGQIALPTGKYTQLRLVLVDNGGTTPLANSVVPTGGSGEVALTTPSAQQSGLKLNTNIDVASNQLADFVIDFDACKSIVSAGNSGKYLLKPVITVIPRYVSGLTGYVDPSLANGSTTLALQQGGVTLRATAPDSAGRFLLQPVAPGAYTLVLTAPGRVTMVVNSVVVSTSTIGVISVVGAGFNPPASPTGTFAGTVTTVVQPVDANVRALQALSSGPVIEVVSRPVDSTTGAFAYALPTAAPLVATYSANASTLIFGADAVAAGRYSLEATSAGVTKTAGPLTLAPATTQTARFAFP